MYGGSYRIATYNENKYFLIVVEDYSKMIWLFLLKPNAYVVLKHFLSFVQILFSKIVKCVRSDNDTKFINFLCDFLFNNLGIIHQTLCVYSP